MHLDSNNPANIETDFTKDWTVQYYPNANRLVFRGKNTQVIYVTKQLLLIVFTRTNDYELHICPHEVAISNDIEDKLLSLINKKLKNKEVNK